MAAIDRRRMLETVLGGLVAATAAVALVPTTAEAMPLSTGTAKTAAGESSSERPILPVHRRRVRRKVCHWHQGRRFCTWRWVWI
jgi:hypothetical protein